jgi:excisionase family DNA binding protein
MASHLEVHGTTYLSTREAAQQAGLSHDYIARLARESRIVATQSGRRWFVDPVSLNRFIEANEIEKRARAAVLRTERQAEQAAHAKLHEFYDKALPAVLRSGAAVYAFLVVLLGLSFGLGIFTTVQSSAVQTMVATAFTSGAAIKSSVTDVQPEAPTQSRVVYETTIAPNTILRDRDEKRPMILLGSQATSSQRAYLESLFSDEVTVQYLADGRGRIVPQVQGADAAQQGVEFLLVPNDTVAPPSSR